MQITDDMIFRLIDDTAEMSRRRAFLECIRLLLRHGETDAAEILSDQYRELFERKGEE